MVCSSAAVQDYVSAAVELCGRVSAGGAGVCGRGSPRLPGVCLSQAAGEPGSVAIARVSNTHSPLASLVHTIVVLLDVYTVKGARSSWQL